MDSLNNTPSYMHSPNSLEDRCFFFDGIFNNVFPSENSMPKLNESVSNSPDPYHEPNEEMNNDDASGFDYLNHNNPLNSLELNGDNNNSEFMHEEKPLDEKDNFNEHDDEYVDPRTRQNTPESLEEVQARISQKQTQKQTESNIQVIEEPQAQADSPFTLNGEKPRKIRERLDYYLKTFKSNVLSFYLKLLNDHLNETIKPEIIKKYTLHFYKPNKDFCSNVKYEDNRNWLDNKMIAFLKIYDKKNKTTNKDTLKKLKDMGLMDNGLEKKLSYTYEDIIIEYMKSTQADSDLYYLEDEIKKKEYRKLLDARNNDSFLNIMKYRKGNTKKSEN